jgi:hypothetical protein
MYGTETLLIQTRFTMCGMEHCLTTLGSNRGLLFTRYNIMIEKGLYYATPEFAKMIQSCGGVWNDTKHRPIVCLIKSSENENLYWAIPMGKLNHRDDSQKKRLDFYLNLPERDIRSCYYHTGRTTSQSIFFMSDATNILTL